MVRVKKMPWLVDGRWVETEAEARAIVHGRTSRRYIPFYGYEPEPRLARISVH